MPSLLLLPRLDSGLHEIITCQQFTGLTPFGSYVQLTNQRDAFLWSLRQNDQFTVRSIAHCLAAWIAQKKYDMEVKIALKIFIRHLQKGVVLTKDNFNLACRRWKGSLKCCFCDLDETINTFSLIVKWLELCEGLYKFLLIQHHMWASCICLIGGWMR